MFRSGKFSRGRRDMVMINSSIEEMNRILRKKLSRKDYDDVCFKYGIDLTGDDGYMNFELTSDRLEIVSKYALANLIADMLGFSVHRNSTISSKKLEVTVKKSERPFVNTLFVKLDKMIGGSIQELVEIQNKLDSTIGRNRKMAAIGIFDYDKLEFPITYSTRKKGDISFVPLGYNSEKRYDAVMLETKQGLEYGKLISGEPAVWTQKDGKIVSLPPVINADFCSVTNETKTLFVDITGTDRHAVNSVTNALAFNLQFFGSVEVVSPSYSSKDIDTGFSLKSEKFNLNQDNISSILGIEIPLKKVASILKAFDYEVHEDNGDSLIIVPPFYRQDIIHQVDIVDDVVRMFGINELPSSELRTYTVGSRLANYRAVENIRNLMIGSGYQELELNVLTNETIQFEKTGIPSSNYAPLIDIKSGDITMTRVNVLPEMLRFVSNNLNKRFPQNLFDIGYVVRKSDADVLFDNQLRLTIISCGKTANVSDIVTVVRRVLSDTFTDAKPSFVKDDDLDGFSKMMIKGRAGFINYNGQNIGIVGEVHPKVLNEFGLEMPASVAEIYLDRLGL